MKASYEKVFHHIAHDGHFDSGCGIFPVSRSAVESESVLYQTLELPESVSGYDFANAPGNEKTD